MMSDDLSEKFMRVWRLDWAGSIVHISERLYEVVEGNIQPRAPCADVELRMPLNGISTVMGSTLGFDFGDGQNFLFYRVITHRLIDIEFPSDCEIHIIENVGPGVRRMTRVKRILAS